MDTADSVCPSRVRAMLASRACRSSVMIGDPLGRNEMQKVTLYAALSILRNLWLEKISSFYSLWASKALCAEITAGLPDMVVCFRYWSIWQSWNLLGTALMVGQPWDTWWILQRLKGQKKVKLTVECFFILIFLLSFSSECGIIITS